MAESSKPCVLDCGELIKLKISEEPLNISTILSFLELRRVVCFSRIWLDSGLAPLAAVSLVMSKGWLPLSTGAPLFSSMSLSALRSPLVLALVLLLLAWPALALSGYCFMFELRLLMPWTLAFMLELFLRFGSLLTDWWLAGARSVVSTFSFD